MRGGEPDRFVGRHPRSLRALSLAAAVVRRQSTEQVSLVASGAAFWLVISALPAAIAVVALFGIVVNPEQVADHLGSLADAAPASLGSLLGGQLQRVAMTDRTGLTIGLLGSVVLALWSASAGVYNLDRAIRDVYGLERQRFVDARARAFAEAFVVVVALGTVALTTAAALAHTPGVLAVAIGAPAVFVGIVAAVTGLYRFAVGRPMPLRVVLPGAVASTTTMAVVLVGFGAYASASTHYTAIYGAFGAAVIAMLATYLAVYVVLLGAVLNVELTHCGRPSSVPSGAPEPPAGDRIPRIEPGPIEK